MSEVFNSTFEISLRMTLLFGTCESAMTADRAAAYDFITIYSSSFGLSTQSLNGENDYSFSEFAVRREIINKALKNMVVDGLMAIHRGSYGFQYQLTDSGKTFNNNLQDEYANEYRELAKKTVSAFHGYNDIKLFELITEESTKALRR